VSKLADQLAMLEERFRDFARRTHRYSPQHFDRVHNLATARGLDPAELHTRTADPLFDEALEQLVDETVRPL
jgi:hypothetical protein